MGELVWEEVGIGGGRLVPSGVISQRGDGQVLRVGNSCQVEELVWVGAGVVGGRLPSGGASVGSSRYWEL